MEDQKILKAGTWITCIEPRLDRVLLHGKKYQVVEDCEYDVTENGGLNGFVTVRAENNKEQGFFLDRFVLEDEFVTRIREMTNETSV